MRSWREPNKIEVGIRYKYIVMHDHFSSAKALMYKLQRIHVKQQTCSGERGKDLFPMVNVMCGIVAILLQFINDCPGGFGSFSQSF